MPSASSKQHRFMSAVAHNPTFAKKAGVPQSVGKDFAAADKGRKFGRSSRAGINIQNTQHGKMDMPFKSLRRYSGLKGGGEIMIPKKMSNRSRIRMPDMRSSMMPMRPTMPPKMAGGMRAGGKVKTFKRGGKAGKVAALAGILGLGALALRDKKTAPVEERTVSASVPTEVKAPVTVAPTMPSTRDNDEFYGYEDAVRNAKLMSEDYYGYDDAVKKAAEMKPNLAKGGFIMKNRKPVLKKKMMGGGMAKYAKGGGIESRGKTKGTVIRMASGGSVSSRADGIAQRGKTKFKTY